MASKSKFSNTKLSLSPIVKELDVKALISYQYFDENIGALFLQNNKKTQFVFGFCSEGLTPYQTLNYFQTFAENLSVTLRDFLDKEQVTFSLESYLDDRPRIQELNELCNQDLSYLQLLATAEKKHTKNLSKQGLRHHKRAIIYSTYTLEAGTKSTDPVEKFLNNLQVFWEKWTGEYSQKYSANMAATFREAYDSGYIRWSQLLRDQTGLKIRPLSSQELWELLWFEFNQSAPGEIPKEIIVSPSDIREKSRSSLDFGEVLFHDQNALPIIDESREYLRIGKDYIGVLIFAEQRELYQDERHLLRFLWESLSSQVLTKISRIKIISQVELGSNTAYKEQLRNLTKQSLLMGRLASKKGEVDVGASLAVDDALQAQVSLHRDDPPVHCACVILIYASSPSELDRLTQIYQSSFPQKSWVLREEEYPWRIWLESLPIKMDRLCSFPFDRRLVYVASQVAGLIPLIKTQRFFDSGIEFTTQEGFSPLHLDFLSQDIPLNCLILGMTRCGKSVLVSGIILNALLRGIPVTIVDYPREDGSGSFSDLADFLSEIASYIDIGDSEVYNNVFQPPDLSHPKISNYGLSPEEIKGKIKKIKLERQQAFQEFLVELLMFMVFGPDKGRGNMKRDADLIRSLLVLAITEFYNNPLICDRFAKAFTSGFGSQNWQNMPTISDFLPFLSPARLKLSDNSDSVEARSSLEYIKTQLRSYLNTKIGQRLIRPTSFDSGSLLQIYCLRSLSNETDAAVVSSLSILTALRRSMTYDLSLFFIDEAPVFFKFPCMAQDVGKLCATGLKSGIRVVIASQQPTAIANSVGSADVLANIQMKLVGRIDSSEPIIQAFMALGFSRDEILRACATNFAPNPHEGYSNWILQYGENLEYLRYYPSSVLLAMVVNNRSEVVARQELYQKTNDKAQALVNLSRKYTKTA